MSGWAVLGGKESIGMAEKQKRTVTQYDVAREAGVTRSMVSYVISGNTERSVAPETRRRILEVIDRLGYRPNKAAQALQQGDVALASKQIGLVLCNADVFRRPYYAEIIAGIHTAAHEHSHHIRFIRFFEELKNPVLFNELIHPEEIGGLILVSTDQCIRTEQDKKLIQHIRERIQKIVCVEWVYEGLSSVVFDRQNTGYKAACHLFECGYNDIAYIGENDDRLRGALLAVQEHGGDSSAMHKEFAYNMEGGYAAIGQLHKSVQGLPRAIVCGSDEVAVGVLCYLNERHIAVPAQVALISIDNIEISGYTTPPLTTMNVQKNSMGFRAVEMIVNNTAGQDENALNIVIPAEIVVREST